MHYYLLTSDWPVRHGQVDPEVGSRFRDENQYACGHYRADARIPRLPVTQQPYGCDLCAVGPPSVALIHERLVRWLSPEILEGVELGEVETVRRRRPGRYRSIWPKNRVIIRGNRQSYCYRCQACEQLIYIPMWNYQDHGFWILRTDLPPSPVFAAHLSLVLSPELFRRLPRFRLRHVLVGRVAVLDEPIDGLPANLEALAPDQERRPPRVDDQEAKRRIWYEEPQVRRPRGFQWLDGTNPRGHPPNLRRERRGQARRGVWTMLCDFCRG